VDFVIWRLFKRSTFHKPSHLLCHGFQRSGSHGRPGPHQINHCIPGLVSHHRNSSVEAFKGPLWCRLHALLGPGGDRIIMDLLIDCGIFSPIEGERGNYLQLSGTPLSELKPVPVPTTGSDVVPSDLKDISTGKSPHALITDIRNPSAIRFVRSRMLYARAALNAKGGVRFGMRHIRTYVSRTQNHKLSLCPDVLNRFPDLEDRQQTIQILRYIFPRQYGMHNVFTSKVDVRETAMPFKDYTLREKELHLAMCRELPENVRTPEQVSRWKSRLPKRLRGETIALVGKLRKLNQKCSYIELLRHYCPIEVTVTVCLHG